VVKELGCRFYYREKLMPGSLETARAGDWMSVLSWSCLDWFRCLLLLLLTEAFIRTGFR